jgi:NADH dehydrogenase
MKRAVVIGAGFAGLWAVKELAGKGVEVTLVDRNNYHAFLPLLYQVGSAEVEPEQIAYPVRTLLRGSGARFIRGAAGDISFAKKSVMCNGLEVPYDYLMIAAGSKTGYFGIKGAREHSFGLKTLDDSIKLRNQVLSCFELAAYCDDPPRRKSLLSFVVVGGGATGIEFSGALTELIHGPLGRDFSGIDLSEIRVTLLEGGSRLAPFFSEKSSAYIKDRLVKSGVDVLLGRRVSSVEPGRVVLAGGESVETETVVWTAGVEAEPLAFDAPPARGPDGRIEVEETLQVKGHEDVFAVGDIAMFMAAERPLPMIAPVATQQGAHAAKNILRMMKGHQPLEFNYRDRGSMATIGRNAAVANIAGRSFHGYFAWIIWLVIHIMNLIGFRNKLFVLINWAWDYLFFERAVRLILPSCCDDPDAASCGSRDCGL